MRKIFLICWFIASFYASMYAAIISPPPANDNCANAIAVIVDGAAVSGTTALATLEAGEIIDCAAFGTNQSVWYYFTATATHVAVSVSSTGGFCFPSTAIWLGGTGCPVAVGCHALSCQSSVNGPSTQVHDLTGLAIGTNYYIQVLYASGGSCGAAGTFDITVTTTIPANPTNPVPVSSCANPSGAVCVFNYQPTIQQILSTCTSYSNPVSANGNNEVYQACFSFTAQYSSAISFNNIITSDCAGGGNVTWFDWQLFDNSCNSVACGDLNNMSASGLQCGNIYKLSLTYEIPICTHTSCVPYVIAIPSTLTLTPNQTICKGSPTTLTASAAGYVNYQWAPSIGLSSTTGSTVTANPPNTKTYTVTGFDAGGCSQSATVVVTVNPVPIISLVATNASCGSANAFISNTVSGGGAPYTFHWSNGASIQSLSAIPAGTYTVTVTNSLGCTASKSTTVNNAGNFSATSTQVNASCTGSANGSIDVTIVPVGTGYPPYTYLWNTGEIIQDIHNLGIGTYTVTITNALGCTSTLSATITQPSPLFLSFSSWANTCNGGANGSVDLTATGGTAPYSYLWSNGASTEDINNLVAGIYFVTVADANTCTYHAGIIISEPSPLVIIVPPATICNGHNATLTATGASTYSWAPSTGLNGTTGASVTASPSVTTTYTIVGSSVTGCTTSTTSIVTVTPCGSPTNISISNITGTNATVNWTGNSCAVKYRIRIRVVGTTAWSTITVTAPAATKIITPLQSLTTYEFQVRTDCNAAGTVASAYSALQTFTTTCNCSKPTNVSVTNISQTAATVSWTGNSCAVKYRLQYRELGTTTWTTKIIVAPIVTKTITGLTAGTVYEYHLRSDCNTAGTINSGWTNTSTITTSPRLEDAEINSSVFYVSPNPCSTCYINGVSDEKNLVVTDIIGRKVKVEFTKSENGFYINMAEQSSGLYIIRNNRTGEVVKFVKE